MKILINTAFLLALWGFHLPLMSQCNLPSDVNIIDKDTSVISFLIEGAVINDLNLNSVCGVNINFSHDFIGDVSIILISPSGQEVTLVGPSVETSPNTQFTNWNVSFVPCSFQAIPDPGIAPKWNNLSGWFQFESYTGSYYPSIGCLEDLNSGTVNGTWSVKIIDAVSFGGGEIESINIVFCNPTGIDCGICIADPGEFVTPALSYCEGKQELSLVPAIAFFGNNPDPQEYTYRYLVFNGNSAISLADSIDLRNANPGMYQVCGLALNRSIENSLPSINGVSNKAEYQALLDASFACASLTPQCLNLTVEDVLDTIIIQESICSNSTFEIEGVTYDSPGEYIVSYSQNSCDSMTILQLSLKFNDQN